MSSYLTFYLVPKKTKKRYDYNNENGNTEIEIKLSEGQPLSLCSYSRSSNVYQAYNETLNPAYCGDEDRYTEVSYDDAQRVISEYKKDLEHAKKRLEIDYKMLKEGGYSSELYEDIHSIEAYLREQRECISELENIANIVYEVSEGFHDFEKVLCNID